MPKFNEFIKGFEEKPEAKNPNPAPTPKPQEVKMEEPKPQPKTKEEQPKKEETFVKNKQGQWVLGKEKEPKAPKYKLSSYFGKNYSGLESSQELDDDIENAIWDKTMKGNFVEVEEPETGKKWRFSPDIEDPYDIALDERFEYGRPAPKADNTDYPYDEEVLKGITRDTPDKAKKLAQALYAYRVTKDTDLAGKLFDEYLGK